MPARPNSTSQRRGMWPSYRRSGLRPRLRRRLARPRRRPRCHGGCRSGGDVSRPGERRPGRGCRPEGDLGREAERRPRRAVHGAQADHRQRELHRKLRRVPGPGPSSRGEARGRLVPALRPHAREDDQRHRSDQGRTATVRAPIEALGGQTNATLGRVSAYFRAEPVGGRRGDADRAANTGPTVWFCLTDRRPRPKWGPCIWPGQVR